MTDFNTHRGRFAALALTATLVCGAGTASAAPVQVTLNFGTTEEFPLSPYIESGFVVSGDFLFFGWKGKPAGFHSP